MKRFLSFTLAAMLVCLLWISPASATIYGTVRGGWLRLRAQPSYQAYVITSYPTGTVVTILSQSGGWCQVITPDQRLGYMDQRYLNMSGSAAPGYSAPSPVYPTYPTSGSWYDVNYTAYVTSANGKGVRLRRNPVVNSYNVLGLYPVGRRLTVLKRSNSGWSYVRIGSQEGYMMSQYITTSYSPVSPTAGPFVPTPTLRPSQYTAYLVTDNGRDIYLRRDASMNFQYIASYPVGTRVTVLGMESGWARILVDGMEGYVQSVYVTTRKPSSVPSDPGIIYYPDPSAEPSYVNPDQDSYPPSSGGNQFPGYGITSVRLTSNNPKVGEMVTVIVAPNTATFTAVWYRDDNVLLTTGNRYTVQATDVGHVLYVRVTGTGAYSGTVVEAMTGIVKAGFAPQPTPVPEGVMQQEWVDDSGFALPEAQTIPQSVQPTPVVTEEWVPFENPPAEEPTVVQEWVDPTPIDSWWTGEEQETPDMSWMDN